MQKDYWQTLYEERYYHIYNRSNGKEQIFQYAEDVNDFLKRFTDLIAPYCDILAYCIMSNHFHFVIHFKHVDDNIKKLIAKENTSKANQFLENKVSYNDFIVAQFARLFQGFSKCYNLKYKRHGNLFQNKFKRVEQKTIEKIVSRVCYVHHNPIHHGAASFYDGYHYSSFNAYIYSKKTKVAIDKNYLIFNKLSSSFIEINKDAPFETGIYEYPTNPSKPLENLLLYHAFFHQEWLKKHQWEDYDDFDEA